MVLDLNGAPPSAPQRNGLSPETASAPKINAAAQTARESKAAPNTRPVCGANSASVPIAANGFTLRPPTSLDGKSLPIPFELKVSAKARQVYLRVEPGRGLQVTIPKRYSKRSIPALVESQRAWITESLVELDEKTPVLYRQWPPPQLYLNACDTMLQVDYSHTPDSVSGKICWDSPECLHLSVDTSNKALVAKCIATALKPFAKSLLGPWLARCAEQSQLQYKRMVVRGQRTVWGSYSSSGTLSLNYKLLFVRPDLVEYVLLHELAHTRHLDHSAAFWRFLDELKPNAAQLDKELKAAGSLPPPWLELVG